MKPENWLERQIREARTDPREIPIREMLSRVIEVAEPKKIIPIAEVPEFGQGVVRKKIVETIVHQGQMGSTTDLPIRTDNAADCNIFIVKNPKMDGVAIYTVIHVWAGDLSLNLAGSKREDIVAVANNESVAIGITGGRSASIIPTAREFKREGITTVKHIDVPTGNRYISVVYRPETNEILVRIGSDVDATEVWVYDGF